MFKAYKKMFKDFFTTFDEKKESAKLFKKTVMLILVVAACYSFIFRDNTPTFAMFNYLWQVFKYILLFLTLAFTSTIFCTLFRLFQNKP